MNISALQAARYEYAPKLPAILQEDLNNLTISLGEATTAVADADKVAELFANTYGKPIANLAKGANANASKKITVGVILSGGQAPGGHNVISGLYDGVKKGNKESKLLGFIGGPSGLLDSDYVEFTDSFINDYRNTGGFDIIGSGRTKIETPEQYAQAAKTAKDLGLDALVIIGGDDSNTNAALLAEYFLQNGLTTQVIGVPKTIDGDLKNEYIETSFGFDTACKTYSELIGNIQRDANSAKKYWHFIKLMGRSASHIGLECGLQTQPNICIVSEEIEAKNMTLVQLTSQLADIIEKRGNAGNNFGTCLIPEGLIEFIPEMKKLIAELNDILAHNAEEFAKLDDLDAQENWLKDKLSPVLFAAFAVLPANIQKQLLLDRDPHGNVQVSLIETEKMLSEMIATELSTRDTFKGKFNALHHFFGYEGRCAFPSNFDADYCYSLGYNAFVLIANGLTGYISSVRNLTQPADKWIAGGIPLTMMMNMEQRHGHSKPVIKKALVELEGNPFKKLVACRDEWAQNTCYLFPGAIQYYGPTEVCDLTTRTLVLEQNS